MKENSNNLKRSPLWYQIYDIVNQLELKEQGDYDRMDKPSCVTEIENLFISKYKVEIKKNKIPYFIFEKGKSIKKGRCFGYFKCSSFTLISCYFFHIRICPSKKDYLELPSAG